MIIKSLSRKSRSFRPGSRGGLGPFASLTRYMNRGIQEEEGKAVLWHNFYGSDRTQEQDIVRDFETNSRLLKERANGNVLYHEILSFSRGHDLKDEKLFRVIADIGQEYLNERAPRQLGYGVIHRDTDHIHLHLMISSNQVGKSERVRLSKKEFSDIQKRIEYFALTRHPELAQTKVYDRDRSAERLKTDVREQAMKTRSREPSRKEVLKTKLHSLFARAGSFQELAALAKADGINFYQRGKSVGVIVRDSDGQERRHRLSTLGVEEHYQQTNTRLSILAQEQRQKPAEPPVRKQEKQPESASRAGREEKQEPPGRRQEKQPEPASRSAPEEKQEREVPQTTALEKEIQEILSKIPGVKDPASQPKEAPDRPKAPPERERDDDR